eukprot:361278-Chlamydomonas_euryale.AAC.16
MSSCRPWRRPAGGMGCRLRDVVRGGHRGAVQGALSPLTPCPVLDRPRAGCRGVGSLVLYRSGCAA